MIAPSAWPTSNVPQEQSLTSDETYDRLLVAIFSESTMQSFQLRSFPPNLSDHDDWHSVSGSSINSCNKPSLVEVPMNLDLLRYQWLWIQSKTSFGHLSSKLVSPNSCLDNDNDSSFFEYETWHDPTLLISLEWSLPGHLGTDKRCASLDDNGWHASYHYRDSSVMWWMTLMPSIGRFHDSVCCKAWPEQNYRSIAPVFFKPASATVIKKQVFFSKWTESLPCPAVTPPTTLKCHIPISAVRGRSPQTS